MGDKSFPFRPLALKALAAAAISAFTLFVMTRTDVLPPDGLDDWLRFWNVLAWAICAASLLPAIFRLFRGRGRHHDAIWAIIFLLVINRLGFLSHASSTLSLITAAILALVMARFADWYQRNDA